MLGEAFGRWLKDKPLTERNAPDIAERICYRNALELIGSIRSGLIPVGGGSDASVDVP